MKIASYFYNWLIDFCIVAYFYFDDFLVFSYLAYIASSSVWNFSLAYFNSTIYYYLTFLNLSYWLTWLVSMNFSFYSIFSFKYSIYWESKAVFFSNSTLYYINFVFKLVNVDFSFYLSTSLFYLMVASSSFSYSTAFYFICNSFYSCYLLWLSPDFSFYTLLCLVSNY